jgi:hypothetical protein
MYRVRAIEAHPLIIIYQVQNQKKGLPRFIQRSVADPECFNPDSDPTIFSSRIQIQTFFHPGSGIRNLGSGARKNSSRISDLSDKKHRIPDPDPQH